jgi:hypothetical protein
LVRWIKNEREGNTLETTGIGKDYLSRTPSAQQLRERMDKWDYMKLKSFCKKRNGLQVEETTHRVRENVC